MQATAAISDSVRRQILMLLKQRPLSAGEVAAQFEISRPAVSRHLRILRECGLAIAEPRGRQIYYRLDTAPLAPLESWLAELQDRWSGPLDALETEVYRTRLDRRRHGRPKEKTA